MMSNGCYNSLEVRQLLKARTISAKKIFLEDVTLESNPSMLGSRIKKLYEQQKDTNTFSDEDKQFLDTLKQQISLRNNTFHVNSNQYTKLVSINDLDDEEMPNNSSCLCIADNDEVVYKIKLNEKVSYKKMQPSSTNHRVNSYISINDDDSVSLDLSVH